MTVAPPIAPPRPTVPWRRLSLFLAIAYGASWGLWAPLIFGWLETEGGLFGTDAGQVSLVAAVVSMSAPSLAVLAVFARFGRPTDVVKATGLTLRPFGRIVRHSLLGMAIFAVISVVTLVIGAAFGYYHFDLAHFSGLREGLGLGPDDALLWPAVGAAVAMFVPCLPLVFGEE